MNAKHILIVALLAALLVGPAMAATIPLNAQILPTIGMVVTPHFPSPWTLIKGDLNVLPGAFDTQVTNDVPVNIVISSSGDGYLLKDGTGPAMADPLRIPVIPLITLSGTPKVLRNVAAGGSFDSWPFSAPAEPSDAPGTYTGTLTIEIVAV